MSRIISGRYGGLYIKNPKHSIRPTTGKAKEYIFNVLQSLEGRRVIDLFSGTGALGIEALSRYADHVTFIDNKQKSIQLISDNLTLIKAPEKTWSCIKNNVLRFLEHDTMLYDVIIADPPYDLTLSPAFFESCKNHLASSGIFVLEYSIRTSFDTGGWEAVRVKKMGDTGIWIFLKNIDLSE